METIKIEKQIEEIEKQIEEIEKQIEEIYEINTENREFRGKENPQVCELWRKLRELMKQL